MAIGVIFSAVDLRMDEISMSAGVNGLDLIKYAREYKMEGLRGLSMYFPAISSAIGAAIAASSYMSFKDKGFLRTEQIKWLSLAAAVLSVAFFFLFRDETGGILILLRLFSDGISMLPGAGLIMQIAGAAVIFWQIRKESMAAQ